MPFRLRLLCRGVNDRLELGIKDAESSNLYWQAPLVSREAKVTLEKPVHGSKSELWSQKAAFLTAHCIADPDRVKGRKFA